MKKISPQKPDALSPYDQTLVCCQNIETIAQLLEACGSHPHDEPLPARLVVCAGALIERETQQLRACLHRLLRTDRTD